MKLKEIMRKMLKLAKNKTIKDLRTKIEKAPNLEGI
jgi:hypothetical protein